MTKTEQLQYILATPVSEMDTSLLTEVFTPEEVGGIVLQKFYGGNIFGILMEQADAIEGIYNILATLVPIQVLGHLEESRTRYRDIKLLNQYLNAIR